MVSFGRLLGRAIDGTNILAGLAVVLMMAQIAIDVAGKYVFNAPMPATIAIVSNYYMVVVAFMPLALAERRSQHISVELLTELMPYNAQRHLYAWTHLYSAILFVLLAYAGWEEAMSRQSIGAFIIERGQRIPIWPAYYLLPIGCALMAATLSYRFLIHLTGARSGLGEVASVSVDRDPADETPETTQ